MRLTQRTNRGSPFRPLSTSPWARRVAAAGGRGARRRPARPRSRTGPGGCCARGSYHAANVYACSAADRAVPRTAQPSSTAYPKRYLVCVFTGSAGFFGSWRGFAAIAFSTSCDAALELRVLARDHRRGVVLDLDVGRRRPRPRRSTCAVRVVRGVNGHDDHAAVDQRAAAGDADDAAPGALADQRAEPGLAEHVREDVAVRGGGLVHQRDHRPVEDRLRVGARERRCASRSACRAASRRRRSMHPGETLPPPLLRTSTIRPSLRIWP